MARTSDKRCVLSAALLLSVVWTCRSQDAACSDLGGCAAQDSETLARDSVLLQSLFSVRESGAELWGKGPEREDEEEEEDWMMEETRDHEWIAGGRDADLAMLSSREKVKFTQAAHVKANAILKEGSSEALVDRTIWTRLFDTEHKHTIEELKRHPELTKTKQASCKRYAGAGGISGLYTYGAPGTALSPLSNPLREDGKFPGLRVVTQRLERVRRVVREYSDPVTFITGIVGLKHPHMDVLVLPMSYHPFEMSASSKASLFPRSDAAFWVNGHYLDMYRDELNPHKHRLDLKVREMLYLSRAVDPNINEYSQEANAREARIVGWNIVAQSVNVKLHRGDVIFRDNVTLFQDPTTQACALGFVPTHHISQWLANLRFAPATFCGIPNIHTGFRNMLHRVIHSDGWAKNVRPALAACPELYVTGHSLGAGQAQLAAACIQRAPAEGEDGWEDYQHFIWTPSPKTTMTLPAIA